MKSRRSFLASLATLAAAPLALLGLKRAAGGNPPETIVGIDWAHASDCSVHNEPAYPAGPCDCGTIGDKVMGVKIDGLPGTWTAERVRGFNEFRLTESDRERLRLLT